MRLGVGQIESEDKELLIQVDVQQKHAFGPRVRFGFDTDRDPQANVAALPLCVGVGIAMDVRHPGHPGEQRRWNSPSPRRLLRVRPGRRTPAATPVGTVKAYGKVSVLLLSGVIEAADSSPVRALRDRRRIPLALACTMGLLKMACAVPQSFSIPCDDLGGLQVGDA